MNGKCPLMHIPQEISEHGRYFKRSQNSQRQKQQAGYLQWNENEIGNWHLISKTEWQWKKVILSSKGKRKVMLDCQNIKANCSDKRKNLRCSQLLQPAREWERERYKGD